MLDGNRFLPETGTPILKIERRMVVLAVELPEPFLVPTVIEKSFTILFMELLVGIVIVTKKLTGGSNRNVQRGPDSLLQYRSRIPNPPFFGGTAKLL
jgi:hypothetical protein